MTPMIHKLDSMPGYTISSGGGWLPGIYDTERAARYAFRFPDDVLLRLNDEICHIEGQGRLITMDDLRAAKRVAETRQNDSREAT